MSTTSMAGAALTTGRRPLVAALGLAGLLLSTAFVTRAEPTTQAWEYRSYKKGTNGEFDKRRWVPGTITLSENNGAATLRIEAGMLDLCTRGDLKVDLVRAADTTTITVLPPVQGCEDFRYVIRNDGSGGVREVKRGDAWKPDGFEHGLTAKH